MEKKKKKVVKKSGRPCLGKTPKKLYSFRMEERFAKKLILSYGSIQKALDEFARILFKTE